jgi:membrane-bound metal-dependent hydrolase YbcI (DUF457 family)
MTPIDHGFSSGLLGFALQPLFRKYLSKPKTAVLMIIAGMLPDIDYVTRLMGKKYYYNAVNNLFLSHRGFTHSLGGIFFFSIVILLFYALFVSLPPYREGKKVLLKFPLIFFLSFLGGALHLFEDYLGPSGPWKGLVLFYPFSNIKYPCLNFYGWYNFFTIYLFLSAFVIVSLVGIILWIIRLKPLWSNLIIVLMVTGTFLTAGNHILKSPGYPEKMGFRKAEAVWKSYQLNILPASFKGFNSRVQEKGMNTLFSKLPGLKMEHYFKAGVMLVEAILVVLFIHMIIYLISLRWRKTLPRGSPIKNFLFTFTILVLLPVVGMGIYYYTKTPIRVTLNKIPIASGFDYPVGDINGMGWNGVSYNGWYMASGFLKPYFHPGEDWNGRGGGNTDFGEPVYAVAEGVVVFAENCFRLGNIIIIQHRLPSKEIVFSLYAHVKELLVNVGDKVKRRQRISSVGKGYKNITYTAHLHFEIRRQNMARYPAIFWPRVLTSLKNVHRPFSMAPTKNWIIAHYYNPSKFIRNHRNLRKHQARKETETGRISTQKRR